MPRNQGPWSGYVPYLYEGAEPSARNRATFWGEAPSMSLRELIVNENPISTSMTST